MHPNFSLRKPQNTNSRFPDSFKQLLPILMNTRLNNSRDCRKSYKIGGAGCFKKK